MSPTIRSERDILSTVVLNGAQDVPRYNNLTGEKRQDSGSSPSPPSDDSPTQNTPLPPLPSTSAPFTVPVPVSSPSDSTIPPTSSPVSTTSSSSSSNEPSGSGNSNQSSSSEHTKALVFGLVGGILALLLLGYITFRLTRRYQRRYQRRVLYESFWEKWNWETYSPIDGDATMPVNHGSTPSSEGARSEGKVYTGPDRGVTTYTWWQKFSFKFVPVAAGGNEGKKSSRSGTLYKVKSWKPGEDFDIDSCAPSTAVDL